MIAAIVVIYHPRIEDVLDNIRSYYFAVDKMLVWRNSPETFTIPPDLEEKTILLGDGRNEYIAKPLNAALEWCGHNGYEYLLTMDQDSRWDNAGHFVSKALSFQENNVALFYSAVFHSVGELIALSV